MAAKRLRVIDIGANMTDPMFRGMYREKQSHPDDLCHVLGRAGKWGVERLFITSGMLSEANEAMKMTKELPGQCKEANAGEIPRLYCTVGVHPTRCGEFLKEGEDGAKSYLQSLWRLVEEGKNSGSVVAIGECGLDYDRLQFCEKEVQQRFFVEQFELAEKAKLPMFLHNRNTEGDFARIIRENRHRFTEGVAHSFTGDESELRELLDLGLYIGVNGCSLKTEENLKVMAMIPLDRLMLETDAPWCDIRNTHAGAKLLKTKFEAKKKERFAEGEMVKSRNEPCTMIQVLEVVAGYRGDVESAEQLAEIVWQNTLRVFFPGEVGSGPEAPPAAAGAPE